MANHFFFNELSVRCRDDELWTQLKPDEARKRLVQFATLLQALGRLGLTVMRTKHSFNIMEFAPGYTFAQFRNEPDTIVRREVIQLIISRATKAPYLDNLEDIAEEAGLFERNHKYHEFKFEEAIVYGLGAAHLMRFLAVSLNTESCWDASSIPLNYVYLDEHTHDGLEIVNVRHACDARHLGELLLQYRPNPKHMLGGWGTFMDLDEQTAQEVLIQSIATVGKKQRYGYYKGQCYVFQSENVLDYHGYPVAGAEIPSDVLRGFLDREIISHAEYNRLLRQNQL